MTRTRTIPSTAVSGGTASPREQLCCTPSPAARSHYPPANTAAFIEAAEMYRDDKRNFDRKVQQTLRGGYVDGQQYERLV